MDVTIIKFVGLLVFLQPPVVPVPARVVLGQVPGLLPSHAALIAYEKSTLIQSNWPVSGQFQSGGVTYEYVAVTNQNVSFSGPHDEFKNDAGPMPHLSCCCQVMTGLRPEYQDVEQPAPSKAAAFFDITNGVLTTDNRDPVDPTKPINSILTFGDKEQLTIFGNNPIGTDYTIVLQFPTRVVVANTPLANLQGGAHAMIDDTPDFLAYYNMGDKAATCRAIPGDKQPNPCAPVSIPCRTIAVDKPAPRPAALTKHDHDLAAAGLQRAKDIAVITDVNCSNSSWP